MGPDLSRISLLLAQGGSEAQRKIRQELGRSDVASAEELQAAQLRHLVRWLPAVAHAVPAYGPRLSAALRRGHNLSWADFRELPILTRADVQDMGARLECQNPPPAFRPVAESTTSGSTGRPLVTKGSRASGEWTRLLRLRFLEWQGFDFDQPCAFISAPTPPGAADPPKGAVGPPWGTPLGTGPSLTLNLRADVSDQLTWLLATRPRYLATFPSNLLALLKLSERRGQPVSSLAAVTLSSEPVSRELVELCRRLWGARVVATYSANETGLLATQVPDEDAYLVQAENVVLEVLREDGTPCAPGEVGRVVVTTLHDLLRPLVRYEVGDYAELGEPPARAAPVLRPGFPRLERVVGRERTMVRLPDGRAIWPYFEFAPLVSLQAVKQWQLVQKQDGSLVVRLVATRVLTPDEEQRVRNVVSEALPGLVAELEYVESIARTERGKYLEFISEL
jgi:phenylacetate-CoA ligase